MQVSMKSIWLLEVTGQELTLISKALTGTLKPAEQKAARELAKNIALMRSHEADQVAEVQAGALKYFQEDPPAE